VTDRKTPAPGVIREAARNPGGKVYEVAPGFGMGGSMPPETIKGWWTVGPDGQIVGDFTPNPDFDPAKVPKPAAPLNSASKPPRIIIKR
jgi:hypothetical protein